MPLLKTKYPHKTKSKYLFLFVHKALSPIKWFHNEKLEALGPGYKAFKFCVTFKSQDLSLCGIEIFEKSMDISIEIKLSDVLTEIRLNASESANFEVSENAKT